MGADGVMPHHHVYLVSMICFLLGNALHGLAQVNDLAQKKSMSRLTVLQNHWIPLTVRAVFSMALFLAFLEGEIVDLITALHIPLPQSLQGVSGLNLNNGPLAAVFGYAFDSALGYIPFLQKIGLPPAIDQPDVTPPAPTTPVPPSAPPGKAA